jgi:hypothetical protein
MVGAVEAFVLSLYTIPADRMNLRGACVSATVDLVCEVPNLVALDLPFPTGLTTVASSVPGDLLLFCRRRTRIHFDKDGFGLGSVRLSSSASWSRTTLCEWLEGPATAISPREELVTITGSCCREKNSADSCNSGGQRFYPMRLKLMCTRETSHVKHVLVTVAQSH